MKIWVRTGKANITNDRTSNGISISHDGLIEAFNRLGIECVDEYPEGNAQTAEQVIPGSRDEYMVIWYGDPLLWDIDACSRGVVGYTRCMEITLPEEMCRILKQCDAVFVACTATSRAFSEQLGMPVYILSGGVKPVLFPNIIRDFNMSPFTFLHMGVAGWRKGTDITCHAFVRAFDSAADVRLQIISQESQMFLELREQFADNDQIEFISKTITNREQIAQEFYAQGHCLVYPSIGEGWGRCLSEGMMTGMPVICFRASAMLDQFNDNCGWWIEADTKKVKGFATPSVEDLARKMVVAYDDRESCRTRGNAARIHALTYHTWDYGISGALPVLQNIYAGKVQ